MLSTYCDEEEAFAAVRWMMRSQASMCPLSHFPDSLLFPGKTAEAEAVTSNL